MPSGRLAAVVAAGLTTLAVAPLAAQQPVMRWRQELRVLDSVPPLMVLVGDRRARLGLTVNMRAGASDEVGALIESVTPSGPADKAGIRSGDIIVQFGANVLTGAPSPMERLRLQGESSLPGLRLIELSSRLGPNDTVAVVLSRNGKRRSASIVSEPWMPELRAWRTPDGGWVYRSDSLEIFFGPAEHEQLRNDFLERPLEMLRSGRTPDESAPGMDFFLPLPLGDLELAPLNPDLGAYFGTADGVLVISVPRNTPLNLKGGDVVLAVDGRKAEGPAHLHRILRSYGPTEVISLTIMRNHRRLTMTGTLLPAGGPTSRR